MGPESGLTVATGPGCGGVTAPAGFRRGGGRGRPEGVGRSRRRPRGQRRPAVGGRRRVHGQPVPGRPGAVDGAVPEVRQVRAVILNSGGANACTGPDGFADTHRTAEHVADRLERRPDRGRRLLHRPDRRPAADGQAPGRRRLGRAEPVAERGGRRRRGHHDHGLGAQARPGHASGWLVGRWDGQGRRHARTGAGDDAGGAHHRRRGRRPRAGRGAAVGGAHDVRPDRLRRLHVHQRHRPAARLGGSRGHAGPRGARRARCTPPAPTWPAS